MAHNCVISTQAAPWLKKIDSQTTICKTFWYTSYALLVRPLWPSATRMVKCLWFANTSSPSARNSRACCRNSCRRHAAHHLAKGVGSVCRWRREQDHAEQEAHDEISDDETKENKQQWLSPDAILTFTFKTIHNMIQLFLMWKRKPLCLYYFHTLCFWDNVEFMNLRLLVEFTVITFRK